jgi:hypothetical protein
MGSDADESAPDIMTSRGMDLLGAPDRDLRGRFRTLLPDR